MSEVAPSEPAKVAPSTLADHVRKMAPRMPEGFWGRIAYEFQNGRFVLATLEEKIKP